MLQLPLCFLLPSSQTHFYCSPLLSISRYTVKSYCWKLYEFYDFHSGLHLNEVTDLWLSSRCILEMSLVSVPYLPLALLSLCSPCQQCQRESATKTNFLLLFGVACCPLGLVDAVEESFGPREARSRSSSHAAAKLEQSTTLRTVSITCLLSISQCPVGSGRKFGTFHLTDGLSKGCCDWQMSLPRDRFSFRTSHGFPELEKACVNSPSNRLP